MIKADRTGLESFPIIRKKILETNRPYFAHVPAIHWNNEWTDETVAAWLDAFGDFQYSTNPDIRAWVLEHFPSRSDSIYEEQLIGIATSMTNDPEEQVEMTARKILWDREIDLP